MHAGHAKYQCVGCDLIVLQCRCWMPGGKPTIPVVCDRCKAKGVKLPSNNEVDSRQKDTSNWSELE